MILSQWTARSSIRRLLCAAVVTGIAGIAGNVWAADILWTGAAGNNNWNTPGNWTGGFVPEAQFEEVGVINNGQTAFLAAAAPDAAGLILGQMAGDSGGLEVRSGGSINFVDSTGAPDGRANIGLDGIGTLAVQRGGSMSTTLLDVNLGSSVLIGTNTGAGVASLTSTGGMFLNGTTTIRGAGHTFSAAGNVVFEGNSTLVAQITSATHSPVRSAAAVTVNGDFKLQFGDGFMPSVGSKWNIIDAQVITGAFANIDVSAVPAPGPGRAYQFATVSGGNGRLLQLQLNTLAQVTVNTDTGAVSLSSPSGTTINIDGYSILSGSGQLNVGQWNSLQDQGVAGWHEASPTSFVLSELNSNVGGSLALGTSGVNLGTPFTLPAFGTAPDIRFRYTSPTGEITDGIVEYTGAAKANNLLLTVDPATGQAQLRNSSNLTLQLVAYSVLSPSGSLLPSNGNWNSLADQGVGAWLEANPTANALNEVFGGTGATTLSPGQAYNLGGLFSGVSGVKDLALEFALAGDVGPRVGAVQYGALTVGLTGDYNGDGKVDAADYVVWRKTGINGQQGYNDWRANFGATAGSGSGSVAAAVGVPEPATASLMMLAVAVASCGLTRKRKS